MPRLSQRRLTLSLQVLSLAAAAWFVWANSVVPRIGREPLSALIAQILTFFVLAAISSVFITLCAYFTLARASLHPPKLRPMEAAAVAVWFAPAMFVATGFSPASLGASLLLVISTTRLLVAQWTPAAARYPGFTPARVLGWRVMIAIAVSAAMHGGIFLIGAGMRLPSAGLFALSASLLTVLTIVTGAHTPRRATELPNAALGVILTLILAAGITVVRYGHGDGGDEGLGRTADATESEQDPRLPAEGNFPGVILLSDAKPKALLVAPALSRGKSSPSNPIHIPFTGEYWMFRAPLRRPPPASFQRTGSPLDLSFSTTDGWPLLMEAHQRLDNPIALDCCGNIEIAILSRDLAPGSAWIELSLIDSKMRLLRTIRLGRAGLRSGGAEVLQFSIPAARFVQFDEFRVEFHQAAHVNKSVKIEIQRFTLLPRIL